MVVIGHVNELKITQIDIKIMLLSVSELYDKVLDAGHLCNRKC